MRTLEQFKELHSGDVRGLDNLTEEEYKYATQVAIWASCGQLGVSGTSFTAGRASLVEPTADAQKIRIYDSVVIMLNSAAHWTKNYYTGLSVRAEEDRDKRGVEVVNEYGLEGAATDREDGIKKETINGKEYYTRVVYVASATSTYIDDYTTKVYSTDAPAGTIFVAENNSPLETVQENGATCYKVVTQVRATGLNSNGEEYYGAFKVCIPVDNVAAEGSFTIKATGGVAQYNLFLAKNSSNKEQSYIVADPGYTTLDAQMPFSWSGTEDLPINASLQVVKAGAGGSPLEGAKFSLTGDKGTTVTGTTDRNGQIIWTDLPADEKFTLAETEPPEGYQITAPMNITLTAGRTEYVTVTDDVEQGFTIKKVDAQNKSALQGAVFLFEQIDGSFKTTGTTGFDGTISFQGDDLPYDEYLLDDGSIIYADKDTGEVAEGVLRYYPPGGKYLTEKQLAAQRAYKERKEKLAAQKSELGDFVYAHSNEGAFHDLPADTMARAAYLATFIHFDTDELWRTERTKLSQKDLPSIMKLSKSTADRFWRNVKDLYFRRDDDGFLHSVGRSFVKGRLNVPYAVEYQKLYVAALKELYEKIPTSQHKRLGYALKMLPYLNFEFNVLCHNPTEKVYDMIEPMTVSDFCYAVGFDQSNVHKLAKEYGKLTFTVDNRREVFCKFVYNGGDLSTAHVYINPRLVYKGTDFRKVEAIGISFAASSKPIE